SGWPRWRQNPSATVPARWRRTLPPRAERPLPGFAARKDAHRALRRNLRRRKHAASAETKIGTWQDSWSCRVEIRERTANWRMTRLATPAPPSGGDYLAFDVGRALRKASASASQNRQNPVACVPRPVLRLFFKWFWLRCPCLVRYRAAPAGRH